MIPLQFGLFWSGSKLSYLRYLTFKTLRYFHPNAKIQLCVANNCKKDGYQWHDEKQDFEMELEGEDYLFRLQDLNVEVIKTDKFDNHLPNFQSDFFRWHWLKENGGFYLDTDQIILKPFDTLPLDNELIYSLYGVKSCGAYAPVGCIGAEKGAKIVQAMNDVLPRFLNPNNYNSVGPFLMRDVLMAKYWGDRMFNAPSTYFYPIPDSYLVFKIYEGTLKLSDESYALHEFGGHPMTQEFNKKYTEDFAKTSGDTISRFLREKEII